MRTLHIPGIPHTATTRTPPFNCCAFTQKIVKFIEMMNPLGYEIKLYSNEASDDFGAELIPVTSKKDYRDTYKDRDFMKEQFEFGSGVMHDKFNENTPKELAKRVKPGDIVLACWGAGHIQILNSLLDEIGQEKYSKLFIVEPFIGYPVTFSEYRVYESYARLNVDVGALNRSGELSAAGVEQPPGFERRHYTQPRHEDFVIPPYFAQSEFEPKSDKSDFYLFIGRITESKGLKEAVNLAQVMGKRLVACGQATTEEFEQVIGGDIPSHVDFLGAVDIETRKSLYRDAELVIMFTYYPEPGGNVFFESIASNTPVITSNRGIFPEVNLQGITGWRCKSFRNIVTAAENIHLIDNDVCGKYAVENFSAERVALIFDAYFQHITRLRDDGYWHFEKGLEVEELDWLIRPYSAERITEYTENVVNRMKLEKKIEDKIKETNISDLISNSDKKTRKEIIKRLSEEA